jgi:hypothetical protein
MVRAGLPRRGVRLFQESGSAMIAAEIVSVAVPFRLESGGFVDFHAADWIASHSFPFPNVNSGCLHLLKQTHE